MFPTVPSVSLGLVKVIRNITEEQAKQDYSKLVNIHPTENDLNKLIGNKFVDYYTFPQRLSLTFIWWVIGNNSVSKNLGK